MEKEKANKLPRYTPDPILAELPEFLKDPKNYEKVQKALLDTLAGQHSHSEIMGWASCITCQNKIINHKNMMQKLGFKTPAHYLQWKKVMDLIINPDKRVKLR